MDWQSLGYALIQVAHNFGAVAVVGGPLLAIWTAHNGAGHDRSLSWLVLGGWVVQIGSGAAFGAASYAWYGRFPDIHGIAVAALIVKGACAIAALALIVAQLVAVRARGSRARRNWGALMALGAVALASAAFLRWFS